MLSSAPRLVALIPGATTEIALIGSPFWIGAAAQADLRVQLPGVADQHLALAEREDGFWAVPHPGVTPVPTLNGRPLSGRTRLRHRDLVTVVPGLTLRFEMPTIGPAVAEQANGAMVLPLAPARLPSRWRRVLRCWRDSRRVARAARVLGLALALAMLCVAIGIGVYAVTRPAPAPPLSEAEAILYDGLLAQASDHVERGAALLDLGLATPALREFARAVHLLRGSRFRDHPWVRPRIAALEATVAMVYRTRRVPVPPSYHGSYPRPSDSEGKVLRSGLRGRMTPSAFVLAVEAVQQRFAAKYGHRITVTGRDHVEHRSLYGSGGAMDLRVRDLTPEQVRFAVAAFRANGVRVKDFSTDAVLHAQIAGARAAGHPDRAGTGLHLHIDRFADRRDRWTVP